MDSGLRTNSPGEAGNSNKRVYEGTSGGSFEGNSGSKKNRVSEGVDAGEDNEVAGGDQNEEPVGNFGFDLNEGILETDSTGGPDSHNYIQFLSDEDDDDVIVGNPFDWEIAAKRRYTKEEKGKGHERIETHLSLSTYPIPQEYEDARLQEQARYAGAAGFKDFTTFPMSGPVIRIKEDAERFRELAKRHAPYLARGRTAYGNDYFDDYGMSSDKKKERNSPTDVAQENSENFSGPFLSALEMIRERNIQQNVEDLIWMESLERHRISVGRLRSVPSLMDLTLKVLFKVHEEIASLDLIPDWLKRKLVDFLCDSRRMNFRILDLVLRDSPTHVHVKDCSWMTEEQFDEMLAKLDMNNLRVLQLDLCGKYPLDYLLHKSIARSSNSLPCLSILSLRGACQLSDDTLKALVTSAPVLKSINFGQCSLLTHYGIKFLADSLAPSLRELYVDDCPRIDGMLMLPSLKKFEHLEVLSVAGVQNVSDEFIRDITITCGHNIKELDLADCLLLTDSSLEFIGNNCPQLCSLNISSLDKLTDMGIHFLTNGCRSIQTLKLHRNGFSDEAVAAFLEASGKSLKILSLNGVKKVGHSTALSLARCSRKLTSLDLSWCRRITDEALTLIIDSCLSLRLLKLFGCTQITDIFMNGYTNYPVKIIGLDSTSLLEDISMLEPGEGLLHFSPYYRYVKFE